MFRIYACVCCTQVVISIFSDINKNLFCAEQPSRLVWSVTWHAYKRIHISHDSPSLNLPSAVAWILTLMSSVKVRCTVANSDPFMRSRQLGTGKTAGMAEIIEQWDSCNHRRWHSLPKGWYRNTEVWPLRPQRSTSGGIQTELSVIGLAWG